MRFSILSIITRLPYMLIISMIVCLFILGLQRFKHVKFNFLKVLLIFLFITYIQVVYEVSFGVSGGLIINRDRHKPNIIPLVNLIKYYRLDMINLIKQAFLNIILYCPIGVLIPFLFKKAKKLYIVTIFTILFSSAIEVIQYFVGRSADIDDVILNTCGAIIGYFVYKSIDIVMNKTH